MIARNVLPITFTRRLEDQLRIVLEGMPIAVSWAGIADGRVQFVNRKYQQMLGYTLEDLPTIVGFLDRVIADREWAQDALSDLQDLFDSNLTQHVDLPGAELEVICKDGSRKTVLFGSTIMPDLGWLITTCLDVTDRKAREEMTRRLAETEPLTGLLNRRAFEQALADRLQEAAADHYLIAMDLDGFKSVNDRFGHSAGDKVLRTIADRIRSVVREGDALARWGGDEFLVLFATVGSRAEIEELKARLGTAIAAPIALADAQVRVGGSLGWAKYPDDGRTAVELLRIADQRMYEAKRRRIGASETA